ncbi:MAG: 3-hydroxyacyl-ACP dehydratase FabZ [Desulfomicrobium sp.]|jgi:3-hydroxyacyl-[acyl-carrier-protein] dehydratase|nr:3-hydroxyacyl-ACP dehydratase FabZ [Desulfomicrobium sp.]NLV96616.1 3-hydroxyacyl-ACP dehydratase FabZ [Desulfovibrionales bacterium]
MTSKPEYGEIVSLDIMDLLPHRYPFLLVDRVLSFEPMKAIHALKNVTLNEPFFQGHFPSYPVMPGVLILEALAQAGGILVIKSLPPEDTTDKIFLFTGMEKVRFRRPVFPGDQLHLHAVYERHKLTLWKTVCKAMVDDKIVAEGILTASIVPRED